MTEIRRGVVAGLMVTEEVTAETDKIILIEATEEEAVKEGPHAGRLVHSDFKVPT